MLIKEILPQHRIEYGNEDAFGNFNRNKYSDLSKDILYASRKVILFEKANRNDDYMINNIDYKTGEYTSSVFHDIMIINYSILDGKVYNDIYTYAIPEKFVVKTTYFGVLNIPADNAYNTKYILDNASKFDIKISKMTTQCMGIWQDYTGNVSNFNIMIPNMIDIGEMQSDLRLYGRYNNMSPTDMVGHTSFGSTAYRVVMDGIVTQDGSEFLPIPYPMFYSTSHSIMHEAPLLFTELVNIKLNLLLDNNTKFMIKTIPDNRTADDPDYHTKEIVGNTDEFKLLNIRKIVNGDYNELAIYDSDKIRFVRENFSNVLLNQLWELFRVLWKKFIVFHMQQLSVGFKLNVADYSTKIYNVKSWTNKVISNYNSMVFLDMCSNDELYSIMYNLSMYGNPEFHNYRFYININDLTYQCEMRYEYRGETYSIIFEDYVFNCIGSIIDFTGIKLAY